jgi:hypothetical protein
MDMSLVLGTWALVVATLILVYITHQATRDDLKVKVHFRFMDRFDDVRMKGHRKLLADKLLAQAPHGDIQEDVLNLFEDIATFQKLGHMNEDLLFSTFSFYMKHWWAATKDYIIEERQRQNNDQSLFADFQRLVDMLYAAESKELGRTRTELEPTPVSIRRFLEDESRLV